MSKSYSDDLLNRIVAAARAAFDVDEPMIPAVAAALGVKLGTANKYLSAARAERGPAEVPYQRYQLGGPEGRRRETVEVVCADCGFAAPATRLCVLLDHVVTVHGRRLTTVERTPRPVGEVAA